MLPLNHSSPRHTKPFSLEVQDKNRIFINHQPLAIRQKGFVSVRDLIPHSPLV
jgi:hypothetical protein